VSSPVPTVGAVVLTQGNRPTELARCLDSLRAQIGVGLEILVVGNGWEPDGLGTGVRVHGLTENLGPAAGRNVGSGLVRGELLFFFDDDAWADDPHLLADAAALFAARPRLGAVQLRVRGPDGTTMRRWIPRLRKGDPGTSGPAFALAEGVTMVRRTAFETIGGWADEFFFGHEGIDLAWRLWDAGWDVHYAGELSVRHPATPPTRHATFFRLTARNRVWVARRNLPAPLVPLYLAAWTLRTQPVLLRRPEALRAWWRGFAEGWQSFPGPRRPMRWRTVAKLTRLGQPPVF
jgi:GT2 family glycosyltransferase